MTQEPETRQVVFASSTLGTIAAAWIAISMTCGPLAHPAPAPTAPSSPHLFQISPIPPGADWTA